MHVHWNMNIHFPLLMTGENPQGTEFMLLGIQGIRIHALGLWLNRSEGKIKSNNPSNSHITRKTSGAYGEDIFPGARKIWPLLKQPNYNGPWSTGCLLNPLNFLMGYHIPASTSRQMSKIDGWQHQKHSDDLKASDRVESVYTEIHKCTWHLPRNLSIFSGIVSKGYVRVRFHLLSPSRAWWWNHNCEM